jgi:uncharacterized membrane protein
MDPAEAPLGVIPRTAFERVLQVLSTAAMLGCGLYVMRNWGTLPQRIPLHFGLSGAADGWGTAKAFWVLPTLGLVLYLGLSVLELFPQAYNYTFPITDQNRAAAYRLGRQLVLWIKTLLVCVFGYITVVTVETSRGSMHGLGAWFGPLLVSSIVFVISAWLLQARRLHS